MKPVFRGQTSLSVLTALAMLLLCMTAHGEAGPNDTVILGTESFWRAHLTMRPTLFGTANTAIPSEDYSQAKAYDRHGPHPVASQSWWKLG
jgi:hypothetical protein